MLSPTQSSPKYQLGQWKARVVHLGCMVNYADSLEYTSVLASHGIGLTEDPLEADFNLVNTCTVTLKANRKSRNAIRKSRCLNPQSKLIVTGCYSEVSPGEVEALGIDLLLPKKGGLATLNEFLEKELSQRVPLFKSGSQPSPIDLIPGPMGGRTRSFLKVQDGCNSFCTFCIIPRARGREWSRPVAEILDLVSKGVERGFKEFSLSGVCLGRYGKEGASAGENNRPFIHLLEKMASIPGVLRIRFGSIDGHDMDEEFIRFLSQFTPFMPHFHIPLQSGSDPLLKVMKRHYSRNQFLSKMALLHNHFPEGSFSTDVIVGFPGETEEDFNQTKDCIEKSGFYRIHVFPYSQRPMTVAAQFPETVSPQVKTQRCQELLHRDFELQTRYYKNQIGKTKTFLIEDCDEGVATGHTDDYCPFELQLPKGTLPEKVINSVGHTQFSGVENLTLKGFYEME